MCNTAEVKQTNKKTAWVQINIVAFLEYENIISTLKSRFKIFLKVILFKYRHKI